MKFLNLTPHGVTNVLTGEIFQPSGVVARVATVSQEVAPGFFLSAAGSVEGLPEQTPGVLLLVSGMVRQALPGRADLISPGALVRDAQGQPVGCKGWEVNPGFGVLAGAL